MRILIVGAGAIGGYFGGRLLQAGRDVTFLVRPRRAAQLAQSGLSIRSPRGDADIAAPTITADQLRAPYDLVLLSCKAYDLDEAMAAFAPAVGTGTSILPLLNGMHHLDLLDARFGTATVLGGQCLISATLDEEGRVRHLADTHNLSFGSRAAGATARLDAIAESLSGANFDSRCSETILQDMWEKWVFIATGAGITCLMRAAIGDVVAAGAADLATALLEECAAIATHQGFAPGAAAMQRSRAAFTTPGSGLTASMLRDVERGARTEVDHVLGDLLRRAGGDHPRLSLLRIARDHLAAYEARRARGIAAAAIAA